MYKCEYCGMLFEKPKMMMEDHGEAFECCPHCEECFSEACECAECGEYVYAYELNNGYCQKCLDRHVDTYRYDPKACFEMSCGEEENVAINSFLACMFIPEQIHEILMRELMAAHEVKPVDCMEFINSERSWFEDKIIEGMR